MFSVHNDSLPLTLAVEAIGTKPPVLVLFQVLLQTGANLRSELSPPDISSGRLPKSHSF